MVALQGGFIAVIAALLIVANEVRRLRVADAPGGNGSRADVWWRVLLGFAVFVGILTLLFAGK